MEISGAYFKDPLGRILTLRGCDAPFPMESESAEFWAAHKTWGYNIARIRLPWDAVEEDGPGMYNEAYIASLRKTLINAGEAGIGIILAPQAAPPHWAPGGREIQELWERFLTCMRHVYRRLKNCAALGAWHISEDTLLFFGEPAVGGSPLEEIAPPIIENFMAKMREVNKRIPALVPGALREKLALESLAYEFTPELKRDDKDKETTIQETLKFFAPQNPNVIAGMENLWENHTKEGIPIHTIAKPGLPHPGGLAWLPPYPMATAGRPISYSWNNDDRTLRYRFLADPAISAPTELYAPLERLGPRPAVKRAPESLKVDYSPKDRRVRIETGDYAGEAEVSLEG